MTTRRLQFAALIAALAGAAGCSARDRGEAPEGAAPQLAAVEAVPARSGSLPLSQRLTGTLAAHNQVEVRAQIAATITAVRVRTGEAVRRGQVLVELEAATQREQLRQAEAAVAVAEAAAGAARARIAEVEAQTVRLRALAAEGLVSPLDLETGEARLSAARAGADEEAARLAAAAATVEERRAAFDRVQVRSPVDGHVGERQAEPGQLAQPGAVLFVVGDLERLIAAIPLSEAMLAFLAPGQPVEIRAAALGAEPLRATLSRVSPFLGEGSFSTVGEIDLPNRGGRLRPGMLVSVEVFHGETAPATLVPTSALWEDPASGLRGVFVADLGGAGEPAADPDADPDADPEGRAAPRPVAFRPVELLGEPRAMAGVRGVAPGEWVVTVGQHLLARDGAAAALVRPTTWERVLELQGLQREDLLRGFLAEQQRQARAAGGESPVPAFQGGR
jgi:RND family efflux transporter MFP subunit